MRYSSAARLCGYTYRVIEIEAEMMKAEQSWVKTENANKPWKQIPVFESIAAGLQLHMSIGYGFTSYGFKRIS